MSTESSRKNEKLENSKDALMKFIKLIEHMSEDFLMSSSKSQGSRPSLFRTAMQHSRKVQDEDEDNGSSGGSKKKSSNKRNVDRKNNRNTSVMQTNNRNTKVKKTN
jgi:hypothetical protein